MCLVMFTSTTHSDQQSSLTCQVIIKFGVLRCSVQKAGCQDDEPRLDENNLVSPHTHTFTHMYTYTTTPKYHPPIPTCTSTHSHTHTTTPKYPQLWGLCPLLTLLSSFPSASSSSPSSWQQQASSAPHFAEGNHRQTDSSHTRQHMGLH